MAVVALLAQDAQSSTGIPAPDLTRLEPAVAEQLDAASLRLTELLDARPAGPADQIAVAYGDLGMAYAAYEFDAAAAVCFAGASALDPEDFRWHHLLGFVKARGGDLDAAEQHFFEALRKQPRYVPAAVRLADIWLARGQPERALPHLMRAVALRPEEASVLDRLGEAALSQRDYNSALTWFQNALAMASDANRLHYSIAMAYRGLGRLEEAKEHLALRGEVGVKPRDPVVDELTDLLGGTAAFLLRGRMAYRAGHYDEAVAAFARAAAESPENVAAQVNLGAALAEGGRKEEAARILRQALEGAPDNLPARFNLGQILRDLGDLEGALAQFETALGIAPGDADINVEYGRTLLAVGRVADAVTAYEMALSLDAAAADAGVEAAEFLLLSERVGEAVALLESLLEARPGEPALSLALVRLLAGSPDLSVRDGARAVALGRELLARHGSVANALALAMALAEAGDCAAAVDLQEQVILNLETAGTDPDAEMLRRLAGYRAGPPCRPSAADSSTNIPSQEDASRY
jgi:tetratricopeptide (TPR) repeat protein